MEPIGTGLVKRSGPPDNAVVRNGLADHWNRDVRPTDGHRRTRGTVRQLNWLRTESREEGAVGRPTEPAEEYARSPPIRIVDELRVLCLRFLQDDRCTLPDAFEVKSEI